MAKGKVEIDVDWNNSKAEKGIKGLKSSMGELRSSGEKVGSMFKSMLGANLISSAVVKSIGTITNGVKDLYSELSDSTKAWKVFEGNLSMIGKGADEIESAKKVMQDYATKTIYSASEMASTYSQLAVIGVSEVDKLVTGFGGLAAATDNPKQAMKTFSQQATQMAGKPTVAWQDFKLMLEQSPAGIAEVAKEMNMSVGELIQSVQKSKIKTEDFFNAVKKVGNNDAFQKMATEFKTVDQAIDGAKETLSNKLLPVFDKLNRVAIDAISGIADSLEKIDFSFITDGIDRVGALFSSSSMLLSINILKNSLDSVKRTIDTLFSLSGDFPWATILSATVKTIAQVIDGVSDAVRGFINGFKETGAVEKFSSALENVIQFIGKLGQAIGESSAWQMFGQVIGEVVGIVSTAVDNIVGFFNKLDPSIIQFMVDAVIRLGGAFILLKGPIGWIKNGISAFGSFKNVGSEALDKVGKSASRSGGFFEKFLQTIKTVSQSAGKLIESLGKSISGVVKSIGTSVSQIAKALGSGIATAAKGIGQGLATAFKGIGAAIAMVPPTTWLALGAGIAIAAAGLALLATQSAGVNEILTALGNAVETIIGALTNFAVAVLPIVITGIQVFAQAISTVAMTIGTVWVNMLIAVGSVIESVGTAIQSIFTGIGTIIQSVGVAIESVFNGIAAVITSVGGVITAVGGAISGVLTSLGSLFESVGNGIKSAMEGVGSVIESVGSAIKSVFEGIGSVIESVGNAIKSVLDGVAAVIEAIGNAALNAGEGFRLFGEGVKLLAEHGLAGAAGIVAVSGAVAGLGAAAWAGNLNGFREDLEKLSDAFIKVGSTSGVVGGALASVTGATNGVGAGFSQLNAIMQQTVNTFNTVATSLSSMGSSMGVSMGTFVSSITQAMGQAQNVVKMAMQQIVQAINTAGTTMQRDGQRAGKGTADGIVNGIRSGVGNAVSTMNSLTNAVRNAAMSGVGSMRSIGAMIAQGLAQGMYSALGSVTAAANQLVAQAERAAKAKAQIHSPSRLFAKQVGRFIPEGVAQGIDKYAHVVDDKVSGMIHTPTVESVISVPYTFNTVSDVRAKEQYAQSKISNDKPVVLQVEAVTMLDKRVIGKEVAEYVLKENDRQHRMKLRMRGDYV